MGLFSMLFGSSQNIDFVPDFTLDEYENWLAFLSQGGTSEQWDLLKQQNNWIFIEDSYALYRKEVNSISRKYYSSLEQIQKDWSTLYNLKDYSGKLAKKIEKECIKNIDYYDKMHEIDIKYGESSPINIPAFKRLAMLYEKQGKYEEAVEVCKKAYLYGMDERSRMLRMIKKAKRQPTHEEMKIAGNE